MDQNNPGTPNPGAPSNPGGPSIFDRGIAKVKSTVSEVSIEQREFMKSFVRMCDDGYRMGWHEANGGNLSYRMKPEEVAACRGYFNEFPGEWIHLGIQAAGLQGEHFVVTGAGRHFRNISTDPSGNVCIIEINQLGDSWRIVWGLKHGGMPTSEFPAHFMYHAVRKGVTNGACRVVYHAHTPQAIALSLVLPPDSRTVTRALWKSMTECVYAFPQGVGILPWMVPGSPEISSATSALVEELDAVIWAQHGVFASGADFNSAFGLMQTIEKAAGIYLQARAATGGAEPAQAVSDENLRAYAAALNVPINGGFLD